MNIAVFADVHGRILLALKLCARWQQETGERIDLILQAGDLATFPDESRLDRATRRHAEKDPTELGFARYFTSAQPEVETVLEQLSCNLLYVRGNHEDHEWLDRLEQQTEEPLFPVDVYHRLFCLKTGVPYTFAAGDEHLTILGIGRIGAPAQARYEKPSYIQPYEQQRLEQIGNASLDLLLTHDSMRDHVYIGSGMEEIRLMIDLYQPRYHFFGHYGGPPFQGVASNGVTHFCKLADLIWDRYDHGLALEAGSMGLLRWHSHDQHSFEIITAPWFRSYTPHTWKHL